MCHIELHLFLSQRGTPTGMLPHLALRRFKCTAAAYADIGTLQTATRYMAPAAAWRRTDNRHTSCPKTPPACRPPKGKPTVRSRMRPRKLRVTGFSLWASRVAAACRLRQSCRRDRGPVTFHESGVPFAAAVIPPQSMPRVITPGEP